MLFTAVSQDILYSIPELLYIILIMLIFGSNVRSIIIGVCVAGWISMARMVRSQIITLKEQEFALAAFVLGANSRRILFKHLIVNSLGTIIVTVTLMIPQAIFRHRWQVSVHWHRMQEHILRFSHIRCCFL